MAETIFLFGAGASQPAGIPTAIEMTERVVTSSQPGELRNALQVIIGGLQMQLSRNHSTGRYPDIERVINAAALLADRSELEFAPFVGNWHPLIEELERRRFTSTDTSRIVQQATRNVWLNSREHDIHRASTAIIENFKRVLTEVIHTMGTLLTERRDGELFQRLGRYLTGKLIELTYIDPNRPDAASYLDSLLSRGKRTTLTIATLNYDNCVEARALALGIPITTGLREIEETNVGFPNTELGIELLKLHGSVNWFWAAEPQYGLPRLRRLVVEVNDREMEKIVARQDFADSTIGVGHHLAVLFGGRNKLTGEGPFLELLETFKRKLYATEHLVTVGYSFRDPHVDHLIRRWLSINQLNRLTIVERPGCNVDEHEFYRTCSAMLPGRIRLLDCGSGALPDTIDAW